jgi:prepilin peptidase CpaA
MHSIAWWPTVIVVTIATFTDVRSRRIPNWLVLPFLAAGITVCSARAGWHGLLQSLEGIALALLLMGGLAALGGMGMGDVKLCAAIGAWIGPSQLLVALVVMALAGGLMAVCWALVQGFFGQLLSNTGTLLTGFGKRGLRPNPEFVLENPRAKSMPYAPAIAIGTLISFFSR